MIFHSYVSLPEGNMIEPWFNHDLTMKLRISHFTINEISASHIVIPGTLSSSVSSNFFSDIQQKSKAHKSVENRRAWSAFSLKMVGLRRESLKIDNIRILWKMYEHVMLTVDPPKLRFSQHVRTHHLKAETTFKHPGIRDSIRQTICGACTWVPAFQPCVPWMKPLIPSPGILVSWYSGFQTTGQLVYHEYTTGLWWISMWSFPKS